MEVKVVFEERVAGIYALYKYLYLQRDLRRGSYGIMRRNSTDT